MKEYAVVTGAANGLGKAFAEELAKRKINTILVDLPEKGLIQLTEAHKSKYNIDSVYYEYDLTLKDNVVELARKINEDYNVYILINNAGVGGTNRFDKVDIDYINTIIQLNVMATSILTHQLLPNLKKQSKSFILNVSSMAAFSAMGYKTVYPASKVFIHNFSRGLNQELKNTNVFLSVVNPGSMRTNKEVTKRINGQGFFGKIGLLSPEKVAEIALRKLFKRDTVIMLNNANRFNWLLMKIVPISIRLPLLSHIMRREIDEAENEKL